MPPIRISERRDRSLVLMQGDCDCTRTEMPADFVRTLYGRAVDEAVSPAWRAAWEFDLDH